MKPCRSPPLRECSYPLAWFQYDTSLIPIVAWILAGVATSGDRRRALVSRVLSPVANTSGHDPVARIIGVRERTCSK